MNNISEIFKKGLEEKKEPIIKEVKINWLEHSHGIINICESIEGDYKTTEAHKKLLKILLAYFTGNPFFESNNVGSLSKGILLTGSVGSGKTLLLEKVFKDYTSDILQKNSYIPFNFKDIAEDYKINGDKAFSEISEYKDYSGGIPKIITRPILIDDLGAGDFILKNFGNDINLIDKIIDVRYRIFSRYRKITHATTNLYVSDFKNIVDERTVSRMAEMFNIIELQDTDFRKIK